MDIGELKQRLQEHFTDGLVTIVGSGLSVAEGIPGMGDLATHLRKEVPPRLSSESSPVWDNISAELDKGTDLENTMLTHRPDPELETLIVELTGSLMLDAEKRIIGDVVNGHRVLRFSRLLKHMLKPNTGIPVVTTNYDRLVEVAAESIGLGVDTLFVGQHLGRLDPKGSRYSLCRGLKQPKKSVHLSFCDHLVLLKPHGSLDWFRQQYEPVRCTLPLENQRLIITPGLNKFRDGYERPFDTHRERANKEIDRATRFLVLGYGFNDDDLQTHLEHQLRNGKPTVLITRSLSPKAQELLSESDAMLAISAHAEGDGAVVTTKGTSTFFAGANLWDLGIFVSEVLEP
jgi:SIR2-like protein